jgi:hypothetical protein
VTGVSPPENISEIEKSETLQEIVFSENFRSEALRELRKSFSEIATSKNFHGWEVPHVIVLEYVPFSPWNGLLSR